MYQFFTDIKIDLMLRDDWKPRNGLPNGYEVFLETVSNNYNTFLPSAIKFYALEKNL